jgi:anthranilate/para-aminobenzoate synthase component II
MHGKTSAIIHGGSGLFEGLPTPFTATRYHSLCVESDSLPKDLEICARSSDGVVQAVAHRTLPISGVQFHPESVLSEHGNRIVRNALRIDTGQGA